MNIIHNSSFASYPLGYNPPRPRGTDQSPGKVDIVNDQDSKPPASSPVQIEGAIAKVGLIKENMFLQKNDNYTNKALQAYNETRKQPLKTELEQIISGVDIYA